MVQSRTVDVFRENNPSWIPWQNVVLGPEEKFFNRPRPTLRRTIMLPTAGVNQVFGLLDLVKAYNGKTDVANLNIDLRVDVDELLPIIDTAEYMGLVTVEQGDIALTETGRSLLNSRMQERKKILRERLRPLEPFTNVTNLLSEKKELSRIDLGRFVNQKYAYVSDLQRQVRLIISWGVFTGIFRYDGESSKLMSELKASS